MLNFLRFTVKRYYDFDLVQNEMAEDVDEPDYELLAFNSGQRYNMVPDHAEAKVLVKEHMTDVIQNFEYF